MIFTSILHWNATKILLKYNKFWNTHNFFQPRLLRHIISLHSDCIVVTLHAGSCSYGVYSCMYTGQFTLQLSYEVELFYIILFYCAAWLILLFAYHFNNVFLYLWQCHSDASMCEGSAHTDLFVPYEWGGH